MLFLNVSVGLLADLEIVEQVLEALHFAVGCVGRCPIYVSADTAAKFTRVTVWHWRVYEIQPFFLIQTAGEGPGPFRVSMMPGGRRAPLD